MQVSAGLAGPSAAVTGAPGVPEPIPVPISAAEAAADNALGGMAGIDVADVSVVCPSPP